MSMYNNTSSIQPVVNDSPSFAVRLPHCQQALTGKDIEEKIKKTKKAIDYTSNMQAVRNTHGGKRFRARKIANRNTLENLYERQALLESAQRMLSEEKQQLESAKKPVSVISSFTETVSSVASGLFWSLPSMSFWGGENA